MTNENKGNRQQGSPNEFNDQNRIVNQQEQNTSVNTGDQDFKENVASRSTEEPPRDLNIHSDYNKDASDSEGGAEIETPHEPEGNDENSTERKLPKM